MPGMRMLQAGVLALAVFAIYAVGASRTIYVGDSGELVAAVYLLGIPHPSGYPLYVLLGKLWTLLVPVGSIAFRMSLFSAACGALAVAGLFLVLDGLRVRRLAALTSSLLLAFSPSFWSQANVQRVYTLNAVFVVAATAVAFRWHRERRCRDLVLVFFLCGLGAANHLFMAVYAVMFTVFVAVSVVERRLARGTPVASPAQEPDTRTAPGAGAPRFDVASWLPHPGAVVAPMAAFAVGLLPYLYLPLRSRADPLLDWGNPESLSGLIGTVLRRDMWHRAWIEGPLDFLVIAGDWLAGAFTELYGIGAALAVAGVVAGWRRRWPVVLPLLVMAANLGTMALHGSRSDIFIWHRYYIPSYVMAALLAGMGLHALIERLARRSAGDRRHGANGLRLACLALPLLMLVNGWSQFDRSRYRIAEDFSRTLLDGLPPGAHLAASDDNILFVLIYLHLVEGVRPDIDLILQGVGGADLPPLHFDPVGEPLFFTHHPNWSVPGIELVPRGLVYQVARPGQPMPPTPIVEDRLDGEDEPRVPKDYLTQNLVGQFHFMLGVTYEAHGDWPRARRELLRAAEAAPRNDVLFYNLGLIYRRNGLLEEALAAFERAHEIHPRYVGVERQIRAIDRVAELRAEVERLRRLEAEMLERLTARGLEPGDPAYHFALAAGLEARGETLAARGHRLRAVR